MFDLRCIIVVTGGSILGLGAPWKIPPLVSLLEAESGTGGTLIAMLVGGVLGGAVAWATSCKKTP
jgi:hypothetical protein